MGKRFHSPRHLENLEAEQRELSSPEMGRLLAILFGVTLLLGLVSGAIWIAWNLLRVHVLR